MADNRSAIEALTGFNREKKVPLPVSGVTMKQEIVGAKEMIAAQAFLKENSENDLKACAYVLRHHTIYPNFKEMTDVELDDLIDDMHYKDVATIVLAFYMDIDLEKREDRETLEKVFRQMEKGDPSSTSPEPTDSP